MRINRKFRLAVLTLTLGLGVSSRSVAQMAVFDSSNYGQMLKQVSQGLRQVQVMQQQLNAETAMLARLPTDVTGPILAFDQQAANLLRQAQGIGYASSNVAQSFQSTYPSSGQTLTMQQVSTGLSDWRNRSRVTLQEAMAAESQVAQSQAKTGSSVSAAIAASQSAAGQTSATQATNQLLAALSTQLTELQTILITAARATETASAEQQSVSAAAVAESTRSLKYTPPQSRLSGSDHL